MGIATGTSLLVAHGKPSCKVTSRQNTQMLEIHMDPWLLTLQIFSHKINSINSRVANPALNPNSNRCTSKNLIPRRQARNLQILKALKKDPWT